MVVPWYPYDPTYLNGEPFGELGLVALAGRRLPVGLRPQPLVLLAVLVGRARIRASTSRATPTTAASVSSSLLTPSAHPQRIDNIWHIDDNAEALLNRIVVRGQLTAAEYATLSRDDLDALNDLICNGLVVKIGSVWMPTNQTWLDLGLADPPTIDRLSTPSKPTPTTPIVVYGHGDAGDTITRLRRRPT